MLLLLLCKYLGPAACWLRCAVGMPKEAEAVIFSWTERYIGYVPCCRLSNITWLGSAAGEHGRHVARNVFVHGVLEVRQWEGGAEILLPRVLAGVPVTVGPCRSGATRDVLLLRLDFRERDMFATTEGLCIL